MHSLHVDKDNLWLPTNTILLQKSHEVKADWQIQTKMHHSYFGKFGRKKSRIHSTLDTRGMIQRMVATALLRVWEKCKSII